jgi:hypothetical protein
MIKKLCRLINKLDETLKKILDSDIHSAILDLRDVLQVNLSRPCTLQFKTV